MLRKFEKVWIKNLNTEINFLISSNNGAKKQRLQGNATELQNPPFPKQVQHKTGLLSNLGFQGAGQFFIKHPNTSSFNSPKHL